MSDQTPTDFQPELWTRRGLLKASACGFGYLALAAMATRSGLAKVITGNPLAPKNPHHTPRAKRVIFFFMGGGPSHLDTFDFKPALAKAGGQSKDETNGKSGKKAPRGKLLPPQFKFSPHGQSGLMISELYPHLSRHADDLCLINGMHTNSPAHPQATVMVHTGSTNFVRPSMGAWINYGLGTLNEDLPGFVTINPPSNQGGAQNYGSAFLPAFYQGTRVGIGNETIKDIRNPVLSTKAQRRQLDLVQSMNRDLLKRTGGNNEVDGIIESYELAYRMQTAVPGVMNLSDESPETRALYGIDQKATKAFGEQCLLARRMAESGVRFIQVSHRGWDQHNNLKTRLASNCLATDQPIAALIQDLKLRGLFKDTLLVWGGEFGRSPQAQNNDGRRHNNRGYSMWMAGGGVKGGLRYGATDELGGTAVVDKMHIHDLHATILHVLGLNHEELTYRYAGRDFRLTDVAGEVATKILS